MSWGIVIGFGPALRLPHLREDDGSHFASVNTLLLCSNAEAWFDISFCFGGGRTLGLRTDGKRSARQTSLSLGMWAVSLVFLVLANPVRTLPMAVHIWGLTVPEGHPLNEVLKANCPSIIRCKNCIDRQSDQ